MALTALARIPRSWRRGLACVVTLMVLFVCLAPRPWVQYLLRGRTEKQVSVSKLPFFDKMVHSGIFAAFAVSWAWALPPTRSARLKVVVATLALGGFTELMQLIPYIERDANVPDFAADAGGGLVGLWAFTLLIPGKSSTPEGEPPGS